VYDDWHAFTEPDLGPNPNGAWTFGYHLSLTDPFVPFDFPAIANDGLVNQWTSFNFDAIGVPGIYSTPNKTPDDYFYHLSGGSVNLNPGLDWQLGEGALHGPSCDVVWTAPAAGSYNIDALFEGRASFAIHNAYASADVHVLLNGTPIFSGPISGFVGIPNNGQSTPSEVAGGVDRTQAYVDTLTLAAGDTLDFYVGDGLRPADYNLDGYTDAGDYVTWRKGLGSTYTEADYDTWRTNYNISNLGSGADSVALTLTISTATGAGVSASIPEPATSLLLAVSGLALAARRVRSR
jgi:hypothetical protein